jgi:hypothetical protein
LWISDRKKEGVLRVFDVKNLVKPVSTDWFWNQYLDLSDQKKSRLGDIVCDRSGTLYVRTDSNGRVQKVKDYDAARELSASVLELTVGDTEYKCFKWPDATTQFTSTQLDGLVFNTPTELVYEEKKSKITAACRESGGHRASTVSLWKLGLFTGAVLGVGSVSAETLRGSARILSAAPNNPPLPVTTVRAGDPFYREFYFSFPIGSRVNATLMDGNNTFDLSSPPVNLRNVSTYFPFSLSANYSSSIGRINETTVLGTADRIEILDKTMGLIRSVSQYTDPFGAFNDTFSNLVSLATIGNKIAVIKGPYIDVFSSTGDSLMKIEPTPPGGAGLGLVGVTSHSNDRMVTWDGKRFIGIFSGNNFQSVTYILAPDTVQGIASDGADNLYVLTATGVIRYRDGSSVGVPLAAVSANTASKIAYLKHVDQSGNVIQRIFISSIPISNVVAMDENGAFKGIIPSSVNVGRIAASEGLLYVGYVSQTVTVFDAITLSQVGQFPLAPGASARSMVVDHNELVVAAGDGGAILIDGQGPSTKDLVGPYILRSKVPLVSGSQSYNLQVQSATGLVTYVSSTVVADADPVFNPTSLAIVAVPGVSLATSGGNLTLSATPGKSIEMRVPMESFVVDDHPIALAGFTITGPIPLTPTVEGFELVLRGAVPESARDVLLSDSDRAIRIEYNDKVQKETGPGIATLLIKTAIAHPLPKLTSALPTALTPLVWHIGAIEKYPIPIEMIGGRVYAPAELPSGYSVVQVAGKWELQGRPVLGSQTAPGAVILVTLAAQDDQGKPLQDSAGAPVQMQICVAVPPDPLTFNSGLVSSLFRLPDPVVGVGKNSGKSLSVPSGTVGSINEFPIGYAFSLREVGGSAVDVPLISTVVSGTQPFLRQTAVGSADVVVGDVPNDLLGKRYILDVTAHAIYNDAPVAGVEPVSFSSSVFGIQPPEGPAFQYESSETLSGAPGQVLRHSFPPIDSDKGADGKHYELTIDGYLPGQYPPGMVFNTTSGAMTWEIHSGILGNSPSVSVGYHVKVVDSFQAVRPSSAMISGSVVVTNGLTASSLPLTVLEDAQGVSIPLQIHSGVVGNVTHPNPITVELWVKQGRLEIGGAQTVAIDAPDAASANVRIAENVIDMGLNYDTSGQIGYRFKDGVNAPLEGVLDIGVTRVNDPAEVAPLPPGSAEYRKPYSFDVTIGSTFRPVDTDSAASLGNVTATVDGRQVPFEITSPGQYRFTVPSKDNSYDVVVKFDDSRGLPSSFVSRVTVVKPTEGTPIYEQTGPMFTFATVSGVLGVIVLTCCCYCQRNSAVRKTDRPVKDMLEHVRSDRHPRSVQEIQSDYFAVTRLVLELNPMGAEGIPTTTMVAKLFPDMVDVLLTQRHRLKTAGYDGFSAVFPCMTDKILNMTELLNRRSVERQFENIPAMLLVSRTLFNLSSIWFCAQKYRANYSSPGFPEKSGRRELAPKMPRETRSSVLKNLSTSLSNMLHHFQSMDRVTMNTDLAYVIVNTELAYKMIEASIDSDTRRALCSPTLDKGAVLAKMWYYFTKSPGPNVTPLLTSMILHSRKFSEDDKSLKRFITDTCAVLKHRGDFGLSVAYIQTLQRVASQAFLGSKSQTTARSAIRQFLDYSDNIPGFWSKNPLCPLGTDPRQVFIRDLARRYNDVESLDPHQILREYQLPVAHVEITSWGALGFSPEWGIVAKVLDVGRSCRPDRSAFLKPPKPESKCGCRGACGCLSLSRMPWSRRVRAISDVPSAHNWPATTAVSATMMVNPLVGAAKSHPDMTATV